MTMAQTESGGGSGDGVPRFAVVGRVNKGKSSILATLVEEADNSKIRISRIPGETTRCFSIPLTLGGETLIEFIDTPGFSRARQALDWMRRRHSEGSGEARIETVRKFVEIHRGEDEFADECQLLEPVLAGAGVVYVVDASKPFRPDFAAEMEILRWTGRPRMAVLNHISGESDFTPEWRDRLGEFFNLTREFNAHRAQFRERIRLLRHLLEIEDENRGKIEKTIRYLESEWDQRRGEAADIVMDLIGKGLTRQTVRNFSGDRVERAYQKEKVEAELKEQYREETRELEARFHQKLTRLYKHLAAESAGDETDGPLAGVDLFARESWQVFGLNQRQLALAGAGAGALTGLALDAAVGGISGGIPTLTGAAAGAALAYFGGKGLAEIRITNPLSIKGETQIGGIKICAGPPKNPNFPWVLLDRILFHFEHLVTRSHGRRDTLVVDFSKLKKSGSGYASRFSRDRRRTLQKWFVQVGEKGRDEVPEGEVFDVIRDALREIEEGELRFVE